MTSQNHYGRPAATVPQIPQISPFSTTYSHASLDVASQNSTPPPRVELDWEILNNPSYLDEYDFDHDFTLFPVDTPMTDYDDDYYGMQMFPALDNSLPPTPSPSSVSNRAGHRCGFCLLAFEKRHELNRHLLKHTKPYACPVADCGASFAEKRGCDRHVKSRHSPSAKPKDAVKCRFCKYASTRPDAVQRHLRTQHGVQVSFKLGNSPATT